MTMEAYRLHCRNHKINQSPFIRAFTALTIASPAANRHKDSYRS